MCVMIQHRAEIEATELRSQMQMLERRVEEQSRQYESSVRSSIGRQYESAVRGSPLWSERASLSDSRQQRYTSDRSSIGYHDKRKHRVGPDPLLPRSSPMARDILFHEHQHAELNRQRRLDEPAEASLFEPTQSSLLSSAGVNKGADQPVEEESAEEQVQGSAAKKKLAKPVVEVKIKEMEPMSTSTLEPRNDGR